MSFSAVGRITGLSVHRVMAICHCYVERAVNLADHSEVKRLAIDETSRAKYRRWRGVRRHEVSCSVNRTIDGSVRASRPESKRLRSQVPRCRACPSETGPTEAGHFAAISLNSAMGSASHIRAYSMNSQTDSVRSPLSTRCAKFIERFSAADTSRPESPAVSRACFSAAIMARWQRVFLCFKALQRLTCVGRYEYSNILNVTKYGTDTARAGTEHKTALWQRAHRKPTCWTSQTGCERLKR